MASSDWVRSMSMAIASPRATPKSSESSSRIPASRERTSRNTSLSTRLSIRFMRWPICRVISSITPGRSPSIRWKVGTGIFQTRDGWTAVAKLSRGKSPNAGSSPKTSPGAT